MPDFGKEDYFFWTKEKDDVLSALQSSEKGLSEKEAQSRLARYGLNEILKRKKKPGIILFFKKFTSPLILILIAASFISAFLGDAVSFFVIVTIILISASIDFYQGYQAEEAAAKLSQKVALTGSVLREGKEEEIPVKKIVVGDIILLSAGDIVPADARLLISRELLVDQSALTGESYPQEKREDYLAQDSAQVSDRLNCLFMGTNVISGEGTAVVYKTGKETEFGRVAGELLAPRPPTEFLTGVRQFGYLLVKVTLILTILVFITNSFLKHDILNSLLFSVALAVGLTPELLPMILTINLSKGALKMSKRGVIVKNLPAIQNFGSMNILCTDKTGTLTENKIKLERYENSQEEEDKDVLLYGFINSHFQAGIKSPLEKAVLEHKEVAIEGFSKVDEIPFDFGRKFLSVIVKNRQGKYLMFTKGAPENVLVLCSKVKVGNLIKVLSSGTIKKINDRFDKLSKGGFRVLALASKEVSFQKTYTPKDETGLTFLGLMAFLDPPKESAKQALEALEHSGITVKILTGDNELVTKKVCEDLGLFISGVATGKMIDGVESDGDLEKLVIGNNIFARLGPEQKERIIKALKKDKNVVGFLGDGINDSTSLRASDVGISVQNGVDVAKESADLILLRKDLSILKDGVLEGRKTYANTMKYIMMSASSNFGNIFSVAVSSLFLPFLPMLPVQILLNNLLYDVSELAVSGDNVNAEYLKKPRKWNITFIKHFMLVFGPISSFFDLLTFLILLVVFKAAAPVFQTGWFTESLLTQTLIVFSIRTFIVPFWKSKPGRFLVINSFAIMILGLLLPFLPFSGIFTLVHLPPNFYLVLAGIIIAYFLAVEQAKKWFYTKYSL